MRGRYLVALLIAASLALTTANAEPARSDLFVLAIGSEHYAKPEGPDSKGFAPLAGVAEGAKRIAELFRDAGARHVRLLTSTATAVVSRNDILAAVDAVVAEQRQSPDALIVIYIAAHGISEGLGWSHYSVPGTMTYHGEVEALATREGIDRHTLATAELVDKLEQSGRHFLLILDTCREGQERDNAGVRETLGDAGVTLIDSVRQATRQLNQFRGPNPVLFSTTPGSSVPTAMDPDDKFASVGPLARRMLLWSKRKGAIRSLEGLVGFLINSASDAETAPAVTFAERAPWWNLALPVAGQGGPALVLNQATGERADRCCEMPPPLPAIPLSGSIRVISAPRGHWLLADEPAVLASPAASLMVASADAKAITIEAEQGDHRWSLTLAAPSTSSLIAGRYLDAERAPFQADGRPGLSLSTTGKSCNEITGNFNVRRIGLSASGLSALDAEVEILCDDIPGKVRFRLDVTTLAHK